MPSPTTDPRDDTVHRSFLVPLPTRRVFLSRLGLTGLWVVLRPVPAWSMPERVQQAIHDRIGERQPLPGGVTLTLPSIAETGNSVPITVAVASPMTPAEHVQRLHLIVSGNPEPVAATFHLGVRAGRAEMSTRLRLARSQTVLALAEMNDGRVCSAAANIVVTLGACLEEIWQN